MKTIGMLGGMSWESTSHYYRLLNEGIKEKLGGLHSAKISMVSIDFHEMEALMQADDWLQITERLINSAKQVEAAGADFLLICTNTMHKIAPQLEVAINIPLLHIADATGEYIRNRKIQSIGLLGTNFTMEQDFYRGRLTAKHQLTVYVPGQKDREIVNRVIFKELCCGTINPSSRQEYLRIVEGLHGDGAEGIILGCTEIGMLIKQEDTTVSLFDTTAIHCEAAVEFALND